MASQKQVPTHADSEALAKRRFFALIIMLALILVLLLVNGFFLLTMPRPEAEGGVFSVTDIFVNGNTKYHDEAVVAASGVYKGQSIFAVNSNRAEETLEAQFPYFENVQVQTVNMREVHITVEEVDVVGVIYTDGCWVPIGRNGKALDTWEITSDRPKRLIRIRGGEMPEDGIRVGEDVMDAYSWAILEEVLDAIEENAFEDITEVDIGVISDIKLTWRDQIEIRLGSAANLKHQIKMLAQEILPNLIELRGSNVRGVLNAGSYSNEALDDQVVFTPQSLLPTSTTAPRPALEEETTKTEASDDESGEEE